MGVLEQQLEQRYGHDYVVRTASCATASATETCADAALVLVDVTSLSGADVLALIRRRHPHVRRLAAVAWGDLQATLKVQEVLQGGLAEYYVIVPQVLPDEEFHRTVSELLEEWARGNGSGFEVVRVIDEPGSRAGHRIRDLLQRNSVPFGSYDPSSETGRRVIEQTAVSRRGLPVVAFADGRVLVQPSARAVADAITGDAERPVPAADVVIIGAGPAGLAAAVYSASEGLSTVALEREAVGGQAGTTSLIRNYLGFPRGITGRELGDRAFRQAWSFGVRILFIREATSLAKDPDGFGVTVSDGTTIRGRSIVLATGVSYRRLGIPALEDLVGAGVYYGAAVTEAGSTRGGHAVVVGGGNSAAQAALHLSKFADRVTMLVRGPDLAATTSEYLVEDLRRAERVTIEPATRLVDGGGDGRLEWVETENRSGSKHRLTTSTLFVLIGAAPATSWLPSDVALDPWGFVLTDREAGSSGGRRSEREPYAFETSLPGLFAVGDVRCGSIKRVASAVGEGSVCVESIHRYLAADRRPVATRPV